MLGERILRSLQPSDRQRRQQMSTDRNISFPFQGETHTARITTYKDGTHNSAIQTFDEAGLPYCRLTTNPGIPLAAGVIVLRDDKE
jgi:hypothetical protein